MKQFKISKLILMMFAAVACLFTMTQPVMAAECSVKTYYSEKEWVVHENIIDVPFDEGNSVYINSEDISMTFWFYGELGFPKNTSSAKLLSPDKTEYTGKGTEQFVFVKFGTELKIDQIMMDIYAVKNDGSYATWHLYEDSSYTSQSFKMGRELASGTGDELISINLSNVQTKTLMIRFDDVEDIKTYGYTYFQITKYQEYEHVRWTTNYIANTDTKTEEYCITGGEFSPNGTGADWQDTALTVFTADAKAVFDYEPQKSSNKYIYDWMKESSFPQNSLPSYSSSWKTFDNIASDNVKGWNCSGADCWAYGEDGSKYILSDDGTKAATYYAMRVYWTPGYTDNWPSGKIDATNDTGWCEGATGHKNVGCTKYMGHTSNARYNEFSIDATYYTVIEDSKQKVASTEYYLVEYKRVNSTLSQAGNPKFLKSVSGDVSETIELTNSGIYAVQAIIKDVNGNSKTVTSEKFYIDAAEPSANFSKDPLSGGWYIETPSYSLNATDILSGINKIEVVQYESKDGIVWYSSGESTAVVDYGYLQGKVNLSSVMNRGVSGLFNLKSSYVFYRAQMIVTDIAGNKYTVMSPIFKYDSIAPRIKITGYSPERYKDDETLNFTNSNVNITVNVRDDESGLSELSLLKGDTLLQNLKVYDAEKNVNTTFVIKERILNSDNYYLQIKDKAGNKSKIKLVVDTIDKVEPQIDSTSGFSCGSVFSGHDRIVVRISDDYSGLNYWEYNLIYRDLWGEENESGWIQVDIPEELIKIPYSALATIKIKAYDKAGNTYSIDDCSFHLNHVYESDISLVDYGYVFGVYEDLFGTNTGITDKIADDFIRFLEEESNVAAKSCLRFLQTKVKTEGFSKAEALQEFFNIFNFNQY